MNDTGLPIVPRRERSESIIPAYDSNTFEHCVRIAVMYARASILPDHYKVFRAEDGRLIDDLRAARDKGERMLLDVEATTSNVAIAVMQARSWNVDPFAMLQSAYVLHGRLGYEGKLVQAMLQAKLGVNFDFEYSGQGDNRTITVSAERADGRRVSIAGTVARWATKDRKGARSRAWTENPDDMLRYRGVRQWARAYEPNLMLGVYGDDELDEMREDYKVTRPRVAAKDIPEAPRQIEARAEPPAPEPEKPRRSLRDKLMEDQPQPEPKSEPERQPEPEPEFDWEQALEEFAVDLQAAKSHDEALDRLAEFEAQDPPPPREIRERAQHRVEDMKPAAEPPLKAAPPPKAQEQRPQPQTKEEWLAVMRQTREPEALTVLSEAIKKWCDATNASDEDREHLWNVYQSRLKLAKAQVR